MGPHRAHRIGTALALSVTLALGGCASIRWDSSWPAPRPLGAEYPTFRPPRAKGLDAPREAYREPTGVLTLREALSHALLQNPRLAAFAWDVRAHEARTLQAALPPDPVLSFRMDDVGGSDDFRGLDSAETTLQLSQLVELGGKRTRRHRVADLDEDVAGWDYETERVVVLTHTAQSFAAVLAAQERLMLAEELVRIAEESLEAVAREVDEGLASPIERTRARVARAAARVDRDRTRAGLLTARSNLAASWGSDEERFERVAGDLSTVKEPPPLASLVARIENNPDLARWATEVERRRAAYELERAHRIPDVTIAAGARRFSSTDDTAVVFGFEIPIPLFNRNQGNVLAARFDLARAEEQRRATRLNILTTLAAVDDRLQSAYQEVVSLREDVLPDAESVFEELLEAFDDGRYPYDDVLDSQRTLFRLRSQYLAALEAFHVAVADIERLIGEPLQTR